MNHQLLRKAVPFLFGLLSVSFLYSWLKHGDDIDLAYFLGFGFVVPQAILDCAMFNGRIVDFLYVNRRTVKFLSWTGCALLLLALIGYAL